MALDNFFTGLNQGYAQQALINNNQLNTLAALTKQAADVYKIDESQNTRANREAQINALNYYNTNFANDKTDRLMGEREATLNRAQNMVDAKGNIVSPADSMADALRGGELNNMYARQLAYSTVVQSADGVARNVASVNPLEAFDYRAAFGGMGAGAKVGNFKGGADGSVIYTSPNGQITNMSRDEATMIALNPLFSQTIDQRNYAKNVADQNAARSMSIQDNAATNQANLAMLNNAARRDQAVQVAMIRNEDGTQTQVPVGTPGSVTTTMPSGGVPMPPVASVIGAPPAAQSNNPPLGLVKQAQAPTQQANPALLEIQNEYQSRVGELERAGLLNTPEGQRARDAYYMDFQRKSNSAFNQQVAAQRAIDERAQIDAAVQRGRLLSLNAPMFSGGGGL